jgi:hypothetical protein
MKHITCPIPKGEISKYINSDGYLDVTIDFYIRDLLANDEEEFTELCDDRIFGDGIWYLSNVSFEVAGHSAPETVRIRVKGEVVDTEDDYGCEDDE